MTNKIIQIYIYSDLKAMKYSIGYHVLLSV
jgi:hypothetical protein